MVRIKIDIFGVLKLFLILDCFENDFSGDVVTEFAK